MNDIHWSEDRKRTILLSENLLYFWTTSSQFLVMLYKFYASHSRKNIYILSFKEENIRAIVLFEVLGKVKGMNYKSDTKKKKKRWIYFQCFWKELWISNQLMQKGNHSFSFWEFQDSPVCTFRSPVT